MVPIADCRFKFSGSQWVPAGGAEPQSLQNIYIHPDSPALGSHWQAQPINFNKTKLTNNTLDSSGHVSRNFKCRFSHETMIEYLRRRIVWKSGLWINTKTAKLFTLSQLLSDSWDLFFIISSRQTDLMKYFVFVLILWQIVLTSMHKYQPRIHIVRTSDPSQIPWSPQKSFGFAETEFVAVTAYQVNESTNYLFDICLAVQASRVWERGSKIWKWSPYAPMDHDNWWFRSFLEATESRQASLFWMTIKDYHR